jgi:hypothetical protein
MGVQKSLGLSDIHETEVLEVLNRPYSVFVPATWEVVPARSGRRPLRFTSIITIAYTRVVDKHVARPFMSLFRGVEAHEAHTS